MRDGQLESCDPYLLLGRLRRRFGANGEVECGELHFILSEQRLLFCDGRRLDAESEVEGGGFILTLERRKILPGERLGAGSDGARTDLDFFFASSRNSFSVVK